MQRIITQTLFLWFCLLLSASQYVVAQVPDTSQNTWGGTDPLRADTCQSTWTGYDSVRENTSFVRGSGYYKVELIQSWNSVTGAKPHTFIITKYGSTTEKVIKTYFNLSGCEVRITDMRLFHGNCYFCGTVKYPFDDVTSGIVGHFSVGLVYSGTGNIYVHTGTEASHLSRLAISEVNINNTTKTVVSIIGKQNHGNTECLLELTDDGSATWHMKVDRVYYPDRILFSDLLNTGDSLTLLAQFKCTNSEFPNGSNYDFSHQIFMLDRFGLGGCSTTYTPSSPYYMMQYLMALSENCSYHYSNAPMRLFHIDDLFNKFGAVFGVRKTSVSLGGMRLFTFQNARQCDSSLYYTTGIHPIIKDVGNIYKSKYLFVISSDDSNTNGVLSSPVFGGASQDVTLLRSPSYSVSSLAQRMLGNYIHITGHNSVGAFMRYEQYGLSFADPTCFNKVSRQYTVFPEKRADLLVVKWEFEEKDDFEWDRAEVFPLEPKKDTVCQKCP